MSNLVEKKFEEGTLGLTFVDGKLVFLVSYEGKQAGAKFEVSLDAKEYLDMLAEAIPGDLDDTVIAAIKAAM